MYLKVKVDSYSIIEIPGHFTAEFRDTNVYYGDYGNYDILKSEFNLRIFND